MSNSDTSRSTTLNVLKTDPKRKPKDLVKKKPSNLTLLSPPKKEFDITNSGTFSMPDFQKQIQIGTSGIKNETMESPGSSKFSFSDLVFEKNAIGKGASASVFKVKYKPRDPLKKCDTLTVDTKYALKKVNLFQKNSAQIIMQEIKQLYKSTSCPFVVKFYEAFHRDGTIQILLEYMEMGSLEDIYQLCDGIPEMVLSEMTFQILNGLEFLEQNKIIHRDIKPSNILVNKKAECKISDFGLSKELLEDFTGTFTGTQLYMSPERLLDNRYTYASDIWSFGLTLVECFTAKPAMEEKEMDVWKFSETIKHYKPNLKGASDEFVEFVSLCLTVDPEKRPNATKLLEHPFVTKSQKEDAITISETMKFLKEKYVKKKRESQEERPRGNSSGIQVHTSTLNQDFEDLLKQAMK